MAIPCEIVLIEQIVARLKQWAQKHPHTKRIKPLDFHDVCYGLKVELESATEGLNEILFRLRENNQTGKADAIEELYGQLLHTVSVEYHRRSDDLAPMYLELDNAKKAASLLVRELQSIKPAKTEEDATSDNGTAKIGQLVKKIIGGIFKKMFSLFGAIIVGIIVAILLMFFGEFGWLEQIYNILRPK